MTRWCGLRGPALAAPLLGLLAMPAAASLPPPAAENPVEITDPLSLIEGSADAWSVSRGEAGCYLLSPSRQDASRLAIGRHPKLGLGLFAVSFALAVPSTNAGEPVVIQAEGREFTKSGRMVGVKLLFVPLAPAEAEAGLRELKATGALWLMIRRTWMSHGGQNVQAAVAEYARACAGTAVK